MKIGETNGLCPVCKGPRKLTHHPRQQVPIFGMLGPSVDWSCADGCGWYALLTGEERIKFLEGDTVNG